ncbi:MAG: sigma-70 family RNA polymerase sigma factor [Acidobacteria bacterium]|nr:sigma-70 family RNA polymerase sigma factor [Acidobacteriota bacterium]
MQSSAEEISSLLHAWCEGDRAALDKLMPLVYDELHRLAHNYMRQERGNQTLQTTALVNEAFLRLVKAQEIEWKDRNHFFAISANLMRRILVDLARSRGYQKRGGDLQRVPLDADLPISSEPDPDLIKLNDALNALANFDPRKAKIVELRFFGGLSVKETAEVLEVSTNTVDRDWELARIWLFCRLKNRG